MKSEIILKKQNWKIDNSKTETKLDSEKIIINNVSSEKIVIEYNEKILIDESIKQVKIEFKGKFENAGGYLSINSKNNIPLNGKSLINIDGETELKIKLVLFAESKISFGDIHLELKERTESLIEEVEKQNDILVITPNYPSLENLYYCAFVHSRVKEYINNGLKVQVASISYINSYQTIYNHENVPVIRGNYNDLKELLARKQYKVIVTHFVDESLYPIFDGFISNEKLIFICHGPETVFRYLVNVTRPYFTDPIPYPKDDVSMNIKEKWVKKFSQKDNVEWVFVSDWLKEFSEKELGIKFKHARVINNIINEELFPYKEKKEEDRCKILVIRKFDNIIQHSLDQVVLAIIELSRRSFFKELTFDIYGDGKYYDILIEPIRNFKNVHLHRTFIPNNEISKIHEKSGILLIPSRHDAHAVAMGEGASSGLVVVGSNVTSNPYFMNDKVNHTLADPEDYVGLANIIERLYKNPKEFLEISERLSKDTRENYCKENTVQKEVKLIKEKVKSYKDEKESLNVKLNIWTKGKYMDTKYFIKKQGRRILDKTKNNKKTFLLFSMILILLTTLFVYKYVKNESPVYIYDYSGYYETYKNFSRELLETPVKFVTDAISTIRNSDYNCTPIIAIIPFYVLLKTSRIGYILGCCLVYVVPTIILTIFILRKMLLKNKEKNDKNGIIFTIFLCITSFLYTRWWSPTLRGLPDIIAVIPILIATIISLKHSFTEKQKIYVPTTIGFMMYLCFLFRRYFIYAIIGFYVSLFIKELILFIKEKENKKEKLINAIKNFLIAGVTTLSLVLLIQFPLVKSIIGQNYSESYSAYQDTISNHVKRTVNEFGYIILIGAIIGLIYTLSNKKHRLNGLFCLTNIVVCYGTFMTVQAMGVHHYLTISPWLFILFVYGVFGIWNLLKSDVLKNMFLCVVITVMALNFSTTYIFRSYRIPIISQNNKYCKFFYKNFDGVEKLIADIDNLVKDKNIKYTVIASSDNLSENLIELLGTDKMKSSSTTISAIDLRDGINFVSLMSEYVVVTDIAQTGTSSTGQRVVSVPNNEIINGTSIGKAYTKVSGPYILQDVNAYIYQKTRPFTEDEVNEYMQILINYYPEWKEKYTAFDYGVLMGERILGEGIGDARRYKYNCIFMLPGFTPTTYKVKLNKKVKKLLLKLYIDEGYKIDSSATDYGNVKLTIKKDNEIVFDNEIKIWNPKNLEIDLSNSDDLEFIVDKNGELSYDNLFIEIENVECIKD